MRYWFQPNMKLRATALWLSVVLLLPVTAWGQTGTPRLSKQNAEGLCKSWRHGLNAKSASVGNSAR